MPHPLIEDRHRGSAGVMAHCFEPIRFWEARASPTAPLWSAATLALAQVEQLPETDRSEAIVDQLNRRIRRHEQTRDAEQQQQFETNQLQTQWQTAPSPIRPRAIGPVRP
jgi:hypothetical protein